MDVILKKETDKSDKFFIFCGQHPWIDRLVLLRVCFKLSALAIGIAEGKFNKNRLT